MNYITTILIVQAGYGIRAGRNIAQGPGVQRPPGSPLSIYNVCLDKGSDQLFATLYTLYIYPSVHKQLIRTLFEAHIVSHLDN